MNVCTMPGTRFGHWWSFFVDKVILELCKHLLWRRNNDTITHTLVVGARDCFHPIAMAMRQLLSGRAGQAALRRCLVQRGGAAAPLVPGHIEPPHVRLPLPRQEVRGGPASPASLPCSVS